MTKLAAQSKGLHKGFTLIELLVVIGILAVLLAITLIAINPARQFAQANDTKRRSDVNAILNAIHQAGADANGVLPAGIPVAPTPAAVIANTGTGVTFCNALVPQYIAALPSDPQAANGGVNITSCTTYDTEYLVQQSSNGRVTVTADGEIDPAVNDIQVTR